MICRGGAAAVCQQRRRAGDRLCQRRGLAELASVVAEHLTKGRLAGITGRLQVTNLKAQDGGMRTSTEVVADEVVFLDAPRKPRGPSGE